MAHSNLSKMSSVAQLLFVSSILQQKDSTPKVREKIASGRENRPFVFIIYSLGAFRNIIYSVNSFILKG